MRRADNLTTILVPLSQNVGTLTAWNPLGLSRSVMGLIYLYLYYCTVELMSKIVYVIRALVGKNNNSLANCIFYPTKKSNQPEDGFITKVETCR